MTSSLNQFYRVMGVSKQSVYQARKRQEVFDSELALLVPISSKKNIQDVGLKRCTMRSNLHL